MANEKVWTEAQLEAAAKIVRSWPCPTPSSFSERTVDLQCELAEAVELLTRMQDQAVFGPSATFNDVADFLERNTGGHDGR